AANVNNTLVFERLFLAAYAVMARIRTVFADKGYDAEHHRELCRIFGVQPQIYQRGQPPGSGLGQRRWPVESSNAWVPSRRGCCHPRPSQTRTCRFPASGSSGESFAPGDVAMDDPGFVDHPSNDAVHDSPVEEAPQMTMVCATPGLDLARWAIRCRFVDRFAGLRVPSRVSRQRFSAPGASLPSDGSR